MTNIFKILWFEDDSTWFDMESKMIRRELKNIYGFQTEIKREYGAEYDSEKLRRSEEHTSELQSLAYLHSFPTRRSSDL